MIPFRASRHQPGDRIEVGGCTVLLRVNKRARRISLRLDSTRGEMVATAPTARRLHEAAAFASERSGWMAELLGKLPDRRPLRPGETIEVLGRPCRLERVDGRRSIGVVEDETGLRVLCAGNDEAFVRAAARALKAYALRVLTERTAAHAQAYGVSMPEVRIMDARSRWGSCTPGRNGAPGRIRYSWRLVFAPWSVMDYVAVHEAAHLVHADHSPRFWAEVRKLIPDEKTPRAWLKAHGSQLHAIGR
jgi:predicted metal-dependent hydrolase